MLRFTGSRYIFLRYASKNTRTDERLTEQLSSYKPIVTSSAERSGVYREAMIKKTDFVLQFIGSRYIFLPLRYRKTLELTSD
ncbi:hypothetical protein ACFP3I_14085 [Chryseobacterium arachidis]|uniref:hypothetical protein n=1 Tax=Chryseobacterium arachidis TaxID=1416778 RepID=UPI00361832CA